MRQRALQISVVCAGAMALSTLAVAGQAAPPAQPAPTAGQLVLKSRKAPARKSTSTHTPWGHPDLQGIWSNATTTPFERPSNLSDKEALTDEELAKLDREGAARRSTDNAPRQGDPGTYNESWWERGNLLKQTALIVDPPNGKVPPLTPEGEKRVAQRAKAIQGRGESDSWEDHNLHERCILYHGIPPLPTGYNNNYQILQTPQYVVIRYEMLNDERIIPLDGRPHLGKGIRQWFGDSRGHWEGDTLVVETTNFNAAAGGLYELGSVTRLQGTGESLRIIERFKRTDADTIDYRFTVDDPTVFTKQWTGSIPYTRIAGPLFEYACHEGNYAMEHMLAGARAQEKAALSKATSPK